MTDSAQIKGFVERIERLDVEQQTVGLDKKSVYDEAKKAGINTKMLRRFISERKRDAKDSQIDKDALDAYRAALGEPGATYRSVAARIGMPKSTLHRLVPNRGNGTAKPEDRDGRIAPHDTIARDAKGNPLQADADGEIIETESPAAKASDAESPQGPLTSTDLAGAAGGVEAPAPITESCGGGESRPASDLPDSNLTDESRAVVSAEQSPSSNKALPQVREASQAQGEAGVASGPQDPIEVVPPPASSAGNAGGSHVTAPDDSPRTSAVTIESPAEGEKSVPSAGGSDARPVIAEPEVATVAAPATDPADDWDDIVAEQRRINEARARFRERQRADEVTA
jgi:uncharacterized protein (UPF0335 family)